MLSIVIPTLNNEKEATPFFRLLKNQSFKDIEIIVADGGSQDRTKIIAKKYGAVVLANKAILPDPGVELGIRHANGKLIMILAMDNFYYDKDAIKKIVEVFNDKTIFAAFPKHDSTKNYALWTKYINFFTDPFSHFVYGDAANARTFKRIYKTLIHRDTYDIYDFTRSKDSPLLSFAQGFTVRSSYRRNKIDLYDDCSPAIDIINSGKRVAFISTVSIYHNTYKNLNQFVRKTRWATRNALENTNFGISLRLNRLSKAQLFRKRIWPIYALSIVAPSVRAVWGVFQDRNLIWFLHPFLCFLSGISSIIEFTLFIRRKEKIARQ